MEHTKLNRQLIINKTMSHVGVYEDEILGHFISVVSGSSILATSRHGAPVPPSIFIGSTSNEKNRGWSDNKSRTTLRAATFSKA